MEKKLEHSLAYYSLIGLMPGKVQKDKLPTEERFSSTVVSACEEMALTTAYFLYLGATQSPGNSGVSVDKLVDLFFAVEASLRIIYAVNNNAPIGSVLGYPLYYLFKRYL